MGVYLHGCLPARKGGLAMATEQRSPDSAVKHRHRQEGPQRHIVVFIFSVILTLIAFAAVAAGVSQRDLCRDSAAGHGRSAGFSADGLLDASEGQGTFDTDSIYAGRLFYRRNLHYHGTVLGLVGLRRLLIMLGLQYFSFEDLWSPLFLAVLLLLTAGYFVLIGPLAGRFSGASAVPIWRRGCFLAECWLFTLRRAVRSACWAISSFPSIWSVWRCPIWWQCR